VAVDGYDHIDTDPDGRRPAHARLDFEGVLAVTDPQRFLERIAEGFGRARAFGHGLLLIRRVWSATMAPSPAVLPGLAPPKPIPMKERSSIVFIEYGQIDVVDGAFVVIDKSNACIPAIEEVLSAGGLPPPEPPGDAQPPQISDGEPTGDAGHRSRP